MVYVFIGLIFIVDYGYLKLFYFLTDYSGNKPENPRDSESVLGDYQRVLLLHLFLLFVALFGGAFKTASPNSLYYFGGYIVLGFVLIAVLKNPFDD